MAEDKATEASISDPVPAAVPPKSHNPSHHRRHKKDSDPFLQLGDDAFKLPDLQSPSKAGEDGSQSASLLADLVLTPLNMISFVLSLVVVDGQQRQWRLSQHASGQEPFWFRLTHWSWLSPQPYQDSMDGTWKHNDNAAAAQNSPDAGFQGWYTRKKHRAVAKMEMSDAFEMRGRVIAALLAWSCLGIFGVVYATRRLYGWMFGY